VNGLVSFVNDLATAMAWFLPAFCYIAAWSSFSFGVWGLWRQSSPQNPFIGKPWIPVFSVVMSGVFAAFDRILTKSATSANVNMQVSLGSSVTGYTDTAATIGGTDPSSAILEIVTDFSLFFEMFGAFCAFFAVVAWNASATGKSNRGRLSCLVQFVFGVILLNPAKEATWLLSYWTTGS